jgi:hypothetical protein
MATEPNHEKEHPRSAEIKDALRRILRSAPFQGSKQSQTLLEYLVEHSLAGHDDELKERIIGVEVFGRKSDYDTTVDAIVRARAGEVRKRLAQYYTSEAGQDSAVRIVITPGSYRPAFVSRAEARGESKDSAVTDQPGIASSHVVEEHPEVVAAASARKLRRKTRWRVWGIAVAAACSVLLAAWAATSTWRTSEFDLFWAPVLDSKRPVIIYTGTIPAYLPSESLANRLVSQNAGDRGQPAEMYRLPPLAEGEVLSANDVVAYRNGLVSAGDITADVTVAAMLSAHHRSVEFHAGPDLSFVDSNLRNSPAVLIGAISNDLTLYVTKDLPFYFDHDWGIRERGGQGRTWHTAAFTTHITSVNAPNATPGAKEGLTSSSESVQTGDQNGPSGYGADSTATEDYAIVGRLLDSKTGSPVVIIAGLQSCGNQAAAEFLTDPVRMKNLAGIPREALERKNLEIVFHTNLINGAPASIDIVAMHSW